MVGLAATPRVLVRLPNWLGDALMARPLLHALRRSRPEARIEALGPEPVLGLLGRERVWDLATPWSPGVRVAPGAELALVLPPSFSSAWAMRRAGARQRLGFAAEGRTPLLTHAWRRPARGELHLSREYLAMAGAMAGATAGPAGLEPVTPPPLRPTDQEIASARALLASGGDVPARWAVLGPGAIYGPAKRWPAERFAALAQRLAAAGVTPLVCGGADDAGVSAAVTRAAGGVARDLAGRTTLGVQLALCANAVATVCNDSGLAHLAAATGGPTVAIFGSTSSAWTAPLGPRVRVVQHAPVCAPCFQRTCAIGYGCLEAVTVDEVMRCVPVGA